jgi:type IV pilus assembly protein PilX
VKRERGVTLLLALLMMICVMLIGASAALMAIEGERAARAGRDGQVAFQAAEDALNDAERDVGADGNPAPGARRTLFSGGSEWGDGCSAPGQGMAAKAASGQAPVWERVDLMGEEDGGRCSLEFGSMTGASMQTGEGFLPFRRPRYIVERILCHQPGEDASAGAVPSYCYRVTVVGFGSRPETQVVLQSVYRRKD